MNNFEPNTIGLNDEAWQRLLNDITNDNTPINFSQPSPLGLDYFAELTHLLKFNSSDDVSGKSNNKLFNFCIFSFSIFAGEFLAQTLQIVEAAPFIESRIVNSKTKPIEEHFSSIVERLHQKWASMNKSFKTKLTVFFLNWKTTLNISWSNFR